MHGMLSHNLEELCRRDTVRESHPIMRCGLWLRSRLYHC
jgi:hypothetical protein